MREKVRYFFHNLKIEYKIWYSIICTLSILLLSVYFLFTTFFKQAILEDSIQNSKVSTQSCADSLANSYTTYMLHFNQIVSDSKFKNVLRQVIYQSSSASEINNSFQETLTSMVSASQFLSAAYFLDNNQNVYRSYGTYSKNEASFYFFEPDDIQGITVLPQITNPLVPENQVIPLIIPLTYNASSGFVLVSDTPKETVLYVVLLMDSISLNNSLNFWYNDDTSHTIFLVGQNGQLLNYSLKDERYTVFKEKELNTFIAEKISSLSSTMTYHSGEYYLTLTPKMHQKIAVVNLTTIDSMVTLFSILRKYMFIILLTGLLFTTFATLLISHFVSKPISNLASVVHQIETNTYTDFVLPKTNDEVGQLNTAINDMYLTIQKQIEHIKLSEREKYHAEIALLAEQINPHLLYNALEFINMEIFSHHEQEASGMVQALANYMRISLSYGKEKIPISQEIEQVHAYLNIMNYRFHNSILLLTDIEPMLREQEILKSILQPFVENSIKHGFTVESAPHSLINPTIEIHFHCIDNKLIIEVEDNGAGFDVDYLSSLLSKEENEEAKKHVGLRNVMRRIYACYPNSTFQLSSIPYYKNTVRLMLDLDTL